MHSLWQPPISSTVPVGVPSWMDPDTQQAESCWVLDDMLCWGVSSALCRSQRSTSWVSFSPLSPLSPPAAGHDAVGLGDNQCKQLRHTTHSTSICIRTNTFIQVMSQQCPQIPPYSHSMYSSLIFSLTPLQTVHTETLQRLWVSLMFALRWTVRTNTLCVL